MINQFKNRDISQLRKALSTGDFSKVRGIEHQTGGAALIPESLERTLRTLSFTEKELKLWNDLAKQEANSVIEEYNVIDSYGADIPPFTPEGVAGPDTTAEYRRNHVKLKTLSTTRQITNVLMNVNTVEDAKTVETESAIKYLMGHAERALFYGDSKLTASGVEGLEWDGVFKQAYRGNDIDLRGKHLTPVTLNKAGAIVRKNYGRPTAVYMPLEASAIFSEMYYPSQRTMMNTTSGSITAGVEVTKFLTVDANIDIKPSTFMTKGLEPLDTGQMAFGEKAPTPPKLTAANDGANEAVGFEVGTYKYAVVAYNNEGRSIVVESDAVTVTEDNKNQAVKLSIQNNVDQVFAPEYFTIYRTEVNGDRFYEIARIPATSNVKGETTEFIDKNETLPNTGMAIVGDFGEESAGFKQLLPMYKMDYAKTAPVDRFGVFLHGAPVLYAPKRFVIIKNISLDRDDYSTNWNKQ